MKIQYYNTLLEEKNLDKSSLQKKFKTDNNSETDKSIANNFNEYFANIGPKTSQNIPISKSMFLDPVDMFKVVVTTNKLKIKTSSGYDEISTKLLNETIHKINIPLTHIIKQSLQTGNSPHTNEDR